MGVWDGSAEVAADSGILETKGQWTLRPEGHPQPDGCGGGSCDDTLPYATEPYLIWEDVKTRHQAQTQDLAWR